MTAISVDERVGKLRSLRAILRQTAVTLAEEGEWLVLIGIAAQLLEIETELQTLERGL